MTRGRLSMVLAAAAVVAGCTGSAILANPPQEFPTLPPGTPQPARPADPVPVVLPRDDAWIRIGVALSNAWAAVRRDPFRVHVHRTRTVIDTATAAGLRPLSRHRGLFWQTIVLERPEA